MTATFNDLVRMAEKSEESFLGMSRDECVATARTFMHQARDQIRQRHKADESGGNVVAMLTELADTVVAGVYSFALCHSPKRRSLQRRVSLCAQGGYGRGQLNPYSDLDIGLIYAGRPSAHLRALSSYFIPFLWDIGYESSFVSRKVSEAVALAKNDTSVFTSYLDCRLLAGNSAPFAKLQLSIRDLRPRDTRSGFAELKLRERSGSLSEEYRDLYTPEPNVKEGAGGLRDYHTALWLLKVAYGVTSLDDAVGQGLLNAEERLELAEALDFLWRIRNELHFNAGRREDRLTFANEQHLAVAFGYADDQSPDTTRFMEDYYGAARRIRRFLRKVARTCDYKDAASLLDTPRPGAVEFAVEDGELYVGLGDSHWFEENPSRLMSVFWECARRSATLAHPTEELIEKNLHLIGDAFQSSDLVRRFFLAICNRPYQAGSAIRQASQTGVLGLYIPEFSAVQDIVRYEDFHHYPVDEHTLRAVEALALIPAMDGPVGECLNSAIEHLSDPYILVLALILHDLGKAGGEEHVEEGVRLVYVIASRMGLVEEDAERVAFLVKHHLLMTHIGIYRDTDDLDIVENFAKTIKSEERLRALLLLSYADMSAVGPNVWNDWKGSLLMKLYLKTESVLLGRSESIAEEFWVEPKARQVRALLSGSHNGDLEDHLRDLGNRYFVAFTPAYIALHMECLDEASRKGLALRCIENKDTNMSDIVICTRDKPGLFSLIAGCFASQLADVNSASLYTRRDGLTLDCFTVVNASNGKPLTNNQIAAVEKVLAKVILKEEEVEKYLDRSRKRLFVLRRSPVPIRTKIAFDNDASRTHTVIDIESSDHTGLLYDVTRAMTSLGLDIASARVVTDARRVRDSFYITLHNAKIEERDLQADIREALMLAIHPRPAVETKGEVS